MIKGLRKKSKNHYPSKITTNSIKYCEIIPTKKVEDLYDENFKSLKKEIEEDTRK